VSAADRAFGWHLRFGPLIHQLMGIRSRDLDLPRSQAEIRQLVCRFEHRRVARTRRKCLQDSIEMYRGYVCDLYLPCCSGVKAKCRRQSTGS
jgi:hypothetical protein